MGESASRRAAGGARAIAAAVAVVLAMIYTPGPAAAARPPSDQEREAWTAEQRRAHGRSLWDKAEDVEPVPSVELEPASAAALPSGVLTTDTADTGAEADDPGSIAAQVLPGRARLGLPTHGTSKGSAGTLPLSATTHGDRGEESPSTVDVEVLDTAAVRAVGVDGVLLKVAPTASRRAPDPFDLSIDISGLKGSADWQARARLVQFPACALTSPGEARCRTIRPVEVATDHATPGTVTGTVDLSETTHSEPTLLAVTADAAGAAGDWSATPLDASASWDVAAHTGSFSWSYPMRTPPVPGGLEPDLSLGYDSGSLDAKVASTNSQAGAIGDGWTLSAGGYVERSYVPCWQDQAATSAGAANNASHKSGDLCWKSDNATLVLGGKATDLIKDRTTGVWRPAHDDNTKVERLIGGWNGDNDKEYWKVSTADGTQYWFGRDQRTAEDGLLYSAWTVPVYGNHPGEPCYNASFASSRCTQAWRWNLDYVVDVHGNSMTLRYAREWNRYGHNNNSSTSSYVSGGTLTRIDYGTRTGADVGATAPAQVVFTTAERCLTTETFDCAPAKLKDNPTRWPDVPADLVCDSTTSCPQVTSPAFFSRKRVVAVTTQVRNAANTGYRSADKWSLTQTFPDPGGETGKQLWLAAIQHQGLAGASGTNVTLPSVTFTGTAMPNRVDELGDYGPPMDRFRLTRIRSEAGGLTDISYSPPDCTTTSLPASPESNTRRCVPVYWTPAGFTDPILEYFHKYVATAVSEDPRVGGSPVVQTHYDYVGSPAWHYDDNELVRPKHRTWGQWRGYATVDVSVGEPGVAENPQLRTRYRYFRGMHGDRDGSGGTRSVSVDGITDHDQFAGMVREEITYDGTAVVERTLTTPWRSSATATDARGKSAHHVATQQGETRTTAPDLTGGLRTTRVTTEFDSYGMPIRVHDAGDLATGADDTCTFTTYVRNTDKNILATALREETVSARCSGTITRPGDVVSDRRYAYDGGLVSSAPTRGLVTRTQELKAYVSGAPQWVTTSTSTYDAYGRLVTSADALGRTARTTYTQSAGLTAAVSTTSPDPDGSGPLAAHVTRTELDPAWGAPLSVTDAAGNTTTGQYDGLGRLTGVWEPGRVQGTHTPTTEFGYTVRDTGTNAVTTRVLNHDASAQVTSTVLFDGLLRQRQTQSPSADRDTPGRVVTDSVYDSRGLAVIQRNPWFATGAPGTGIVSPVNNAAVPSSTRIEYDGAGRAVAEVFMSGADEKWRTTTAYRGDRTLVDPPVGGTPTMSIVDARGNMTELRQYLGAAPSGTFQATSYAYDHAGRLAGVSDAAGNRWSYSYDLRGRQTAATDPDKGTVTTTYDDAGQVVTSTDARGEKLAHTYDGLGRRTSTRDDTVGGPVRAAWTYDTVAVGQLSGTSRFVDGARYDTAITGYDAVGRPLGQSVTIPDTPATTSVAGTYATTVTYTADGRVKSQRLPATGNLFAETVTTHFDTANQAEWMAGNFPFGTYVSASDYSAYGQLVRADVGGAWSVNLLYDHEVDTRRLAGLRVQRETAGGYDYDTAYTYDAAGNVRKIANSPTVAGVARDVQCFGYDGLRRLTRAWTPASGDCAPAPSVAGLGGANPYWTDWQFDQVGNRTAAKQHAPASGGSGALTGTYTYPAAGQPRAHAVASVTTTNAAGQSVGVSSFAYDAAGNMTSRQLAGQPAQTLTWDAEGELAQVAADGNGDGDTTDVGEKDGYVYTADGDRLLRVQDGTITAYLPGGIELTGPAAGQTGATSAVRYYEFAGQTMAVRTGSGSRGTTTLVADHHGTAQLQVNQNDNTVTRRYTDPYGATRGAVAGDADADGRLDGTSRWAGDHGFLDKPVDATGLTAIGARMYDAVLGRFISVDPIMDLTDPQQWNAYSYSNNNPVTWSDPTGELPIPMIDGMYGSPKAAGYARTQTKKAKAIAQAGAVESLAIPGTKTNRNTSKAPTAKTSTPSRQQNDDKSRIFDGMTAGEVAQRVVGGAVPADTNESRGWTWAFQDWWNGSTKLISRASLVYGLLELAASFDARCKQIECARKGPALLGDGRFWLTVVQTGVEYVAPTVGGAVGASIGLNVVGAAAAAAGSLGGAPGVAIGGTAGLAIGAIAGAGLGAAAGSNYGNELNRRLANVWARRGWLD